jgi:hypothetical protein
MEKDVYIIVLTRNGFGHRLSDFIINSSGTNSMANTPIDILGEL